MMKDLEGATGAGFGAEMLRTCWCGAVEYGRGC